MVTSAKNNTKSQLDVACYADDFTGSTDVLEVLSTANFETRLFVDAPTPAELRDVPDLQAVVVSGATRSLPTDELESTVRAAFRAMLALTPRIVRYKVCSTFDSSTLIGSIGKAMDVGAEVFRSPFIPIVVGAPPLGRYSVFGNLFARSGLDSEPFRLDLHPTMSCHPVTPMTESDIRLHLASQTDLLIALFNVLNVSAPLDIARRRFASTLQARPDAVLIDLLLDEHLATVGTLLWDSVPADRPLFVVGSSGADMALGARHLELSRTVRRSYVSPGPTDQILVVSGSCSPVTARQIETAAASGFELIGLDAVGAVSLERLEGVVAAAVAAVDRQLDLGRSVIVHTALGPRDPRIAAALAALEQQGLSTVAARARAPQLLGRALGLVARRVIEARPLRRLLTAGGDTSSHVARALGIRALEMLAPMAPGSPWCRAHAPGEAIDARVICCKGGQVGTPELFLDALHGRANQRSTA